MSEDYNVGFGKPPRKSQWPKGTSGNKKGRPKGAKSLGAVVKKQLTDKVQLLQNGKPKKVSKVEALVMRLVKDALEGKARAQTEIIKLAQMYLPEDAQADAMQQPVNSEDQALIEAFVKRMMASQNEGGNDDDTC